MPLEGVVQYLGSVCAGLAPGRGQMVMGRFSGSLGRLLPFPGALQEMVDGFHGLLDLTVVDAVVDEFSVPFRVYNAGYPKDPKMLGGNGLFEFQGVVDLVNIDGFVLVDKLQDLQPEGMGQCPKYLRRYL